MKLITDSALIFDFIEQHQVPANGFKSSFTHVAEIDKGYYVIIYDKSNDAEQLAMIEISRTTFLNINISEFAEMLFTEIKNKHLLEEAVSKLEKAIFDAPSSGYFYDAH